ncbi:MAG: hypothetical protein HXX10_28820, partial [Rhodoplanes sp.]|uniref:hypothetical protein n=1 Tax=Rhodoplanes sp. TaxID=1968906 RepID=UPI0017D30910
MPSNAKVDNSLSPVAAASNQSPISSMDLASETSSSSYRIVAGANLASANPVAVTSGSSADVTVDGHVSYANPQANSSNSVASTISVGNVVRTGTGSITIAASGDFELLDTTAPGAVYTAGSAVATPSDFTSPGMSSSYVSNPNGLVSTPTWAEGGGSVTVAVGGDIVGIETTSLDGTASWASWYYHLIKSNGNSTAQFTGTNSNNVAARQTAAWINYATYADGIGALGGGNVTLTAGGSIKDVIVSLPQTIVVSGGTAAVPTATEHTYGGGNLKVEAGGDLVGGAVLVGAGTGTIRIGGAVTADSAGKTLNLAVQDGVISLMAGGAITLGAITDPAMLRNDSLLAAQAYTPGDALPGGVMGIGLGPFLGAPFTSYSAGSSVSLTSVSGDVVIGASSSDNLLLPATLAIDAVSGSIRVNTSLALIPSATGTLTLLAGGSISTPLYSAGTGAFGIAMLDGTSASYVDPLGTPAPAVLSSAVHAGDDVPVVIYAGQDISGSFTLIKPAKVEAGRDIVNMSFIGRNNSASDIASIVAGRDIRAISAITYGPGDFPVEAGRNLGPLY